MVERLCVFHAFLFQSGLGVPLHHCSLYSVDKKVWVVGLMFFKNLSSLLVVGVPYHHLGGNRCTKTEDWPDLPRSLLSNYI